MSTGFKSRYLLDRERDCLGEGAQLKTVVDVSQHFGISRQEVCDLARTVSHRGVRLGRRPRTAAAFEYPLDPVDRLSDVIVIEYQVRVVDEWGQLHLESVAVGSNRVLQFQQVLNVSSKHGDKKLPYM